MPDDATPSFVSRDTTPEADAFQLEAYKRLGGAARVATMFRLNAMVRSAAMAGIKRRHPAYDARQVQMAWQRLVLGDALVQAAFPGRELIEP